MAFQKEKIVKNFSANYWRIISYSAHFDRNDAVVVLGLYKDKATREADANAVIDSATINMGDGYHKLVNSKNDKIKNIKLGEAYAYLKTLAEDENSPDEVKFFIDAVDV